MAEAARRPCTVHFLTALWISLHAYTRAYPEADPPREVQDALYDALAALRYILPCEKCVPHYRARFAAGEEALRAALREGRAAVVRWMVDVHNDVNASQGKRALSYAEADAQWEAWSGSAHGCSDCTLPRPQAAEAAAAALEATEARGFPSASRLAVRDVEERSVSDAASAGAAVMVLAAILLVVAFVAQRHTVAAAAAAASAPKNALR